VNSCNNNCLVTCKPQNCLLQTTVYTSKTLCSRKCALKSKCKLDCVKKDKLCPYLRNGLENFSAAAAYTWTTVIEPDFSDFLFRGDGWTAVVKYNLCWTNAQVLAWRKEVERLCFAATGADFRDPADGGTMTVTVLNPGAIKTDQIKQIVGGDFDGFILTPTYEAGEGTVPCINDPTGFRPTMSTPSMRCRPDLELDSDHSRVEELGMFVIAPPGGTVKGTLGGTNGVTLASGGFVATWGFHVGYYTQYLCKEKKYAIAKHIFRFDPNEIFLICPSIAPDPVPAGKAANLILTLNMRYRSKIFGEGMLGGNVYIEPTTGGKFHAKSRQYITFPVNLVPFNHA